MQYIGDVKAGTFMGSDQCVPRYMSSRILKQSGVHTRRFGNRYFENLNAEQEVPGMSGVHLLSSYILFSHHGNLKIKKKNLQVVIVGSTLPR